MSMLFLLSFSIKLAICELENKPQILEQSYERINYQAATGKYVNSAYTSSHKIPSSRFSYDGTPGKSGTYSLSNIWSDNNYYWVSKEKNTATFHSNITINFRDVTTIEAFLLAGKSGDKDNDGNTDYHGFPTKIKVYTSPDDNEPELHTIFVGNPVEPLTIAQFVFSNPVICKKLYIEICEVTVDNIYSNGEHVAVIRYLGLMEASDHDDITYSALSGNYDDSNYVSIHSVSSSQINWKYATSERETYPIENAFNGNTKNYWVSNDVVSSTSTVSIYINFTETILLEGLLIGALYKDTSYIVTTTRSFYGYPTKLNLYVSNGDDDFKLHTTFSGTPSGNSNEYFQFIPYDTIKCSKIRLEILDVTNEKQVTKGTKTPAISDIKIIQIFNDDTLPFEKVNGNYANQEIVNSLKIPVKTSSSTGDKGTYSASNAFDEKSNTYWVSSLANTDTIHSCLFATFSEPALLEAFLFDASYTSNYGSRKFNGFPLKLKIYTALEEDDEYVLAATFAGTPDKSLERAQFVLPNPVNCTRVKLEFVEVTENSKYASGGKNAATAGILFIKKDDYDYLEYHTITSYDDSHKLPSSMLKYSSSGDGNKYPISNAFDGGTSTFWISKYENNNTFQSYIDINFTEPVLLEGFIISSYYESYLWTTYGYGYPTKLKVYTSTSDEEPLTLSAIFIGTPGDESYQFEFKNKIPCSRVKLVFAEVKVDSNNKKIAAVADIIIIAEIIKLPGTGDDNDKDFNAQIVNKAYPRNGVYDTNFTDFTLPLGDDYLFVVERKFEFENDEFAPRTKLSAIKNNNTNKVTVKKCSFNNCSVRSNEGNGGAILSINACLFCETSNFINCSSNTGGGGGGIFIVLNEHIDENVIINKCSFTSCSALFGAGIYAFSELETNCVSIQNCDFSLNSLLPQKENSLTGGCAIYLQTKQAMVRRCKFGNNVGCDSVKIDNEFDNVAIPRIKEFLSISSVQIKDCVFEIDSNSDSSIYYRRSDKRAVSVDIKECIFKGELAKNAHHIYIDSVSKESKSPKLHIKSCKFSSDQTNSINLNLKDKEFTYKFDAIDLNKQVFNFKDENEVNNFESQCKISYLILPFSFVIVVLALIFILSKNNTYKSNESNNISNFENGKEYDESDINEKIIL